MPARAMWKAEICLDSLRVPVKLFAAVEDTKTRFRLLSKANLTPVTQQMVDPTTNEPVPAEEIQRAVQVERGVFVTITADELDDLEPEQSREIVVRQVVKRSEIDDRWFDRPYYLGPDGDEDHYFALAEALAESRQLAVAKWVMRSENYAGVVYPDSGYLMLSTFRLTEELAKIDHIRPEPSRTPDKRELALADQLISALEDSFDPHAYRDEYGDRVQDFLRKKAAGKTVRFPTRPKPVKSDSSLLETLEASLKGEKGAGRDAKKQ